MIILWALPGDRLGQEGLPPGASRTEFFWDNRVRKSRKLTSGKGVLEPKEGGRKYAGDVLGGEPASPVAPKEEGPAGSTV